MLDAIYPPLLGSSFPFLPRHIHHHHSFTNTSFFSSITCPYHINLLSRTFIYISPTTLLLTVTNCFRLLPSKRCQRFSPWQPSILCQWPSLGWCHRCACHFSVGQAIPSLDVPSVGVPSPSYLVCFLLCESLPFVSHVHTMRVVFVSGPNW